MSASTYKQLEQEFRRLHAFRGALVAAALGRGSDDAARQRRCARRAARRARDRASRAAHLAAHLPAARSRPGQRPGPRGLAAREPARDAPPARSRDRHARDADLAARQGHLACGGAVARSAPAGQVRALRAASRGSRQPGARQGGAARPGAEPRALRRAGGRVHARASPPPRSMRCSRRCRAACPR